MRKNIAKFGLGLLALAVTGISALSLAPLAAFADTGVKTERAAVFEESYTCGTTLDLPAHTLSDGQKEYSASAIVPTPSGATVKGSEITLSEAGRYTVSYVATAAGGEMLREGFSFIATESLYSVTSSISSVGYGHSLANYDITTDVVLASVGSRDRFEYHPIINLNELDGTEFIEFFVTPEIISTPDASKIQVMLTDVHDEENFVLISIKKGTAAQAGAKWAETNSYITGNCVGQVPAGLEKGYTGIVVYGSDYRLQKGTVWGANVPFALPGNPNYLSLDEPNNNPEDVATQSLKLSMDNESGDIYANGQLVTVLKNSDIYGDTLWQGFTTGECYLSVYGESFNAGSLGLGIKSINGVALTEENSFADSKAPVITVDYGGETAVPNAVTGKPYKIFDAAAHDDYSGACAVESRVYYGYGTDGEVRLNVSDNAFTPIKAGVYTIVYSAQDRYGNAATTEVEVTAETDSASTLTVSVADAENGVAGSEYILEIPSFANERGQTSWYAVASLNGNADVSYTITAEEGRFVPEYAGTYTLTYHYSDYIIEGTVQKSFDVAASQTPVLHGTPVLPKYVMLGCEYVLPELLGTVYTDGTPVVKSCEILVKEDGGSERKLGTKLITYAQQYIELIYRIADGSGSEIKSERIPVVDVGYNGIYRIDKYFYSDEFTATATKDYIRFTADKAEGSSARMTFINRLQVFDFSLRTYASGNGFTKLSIILTDATDERVQVKFTYRNVSGIVWFSINDGDEVSLAGAAFNDANASLLLGYNGLNNTVMPTGIPALSYPVTADMAGNAFKGFAEMSAYMTVELDGITNKNNASLNIVNLNGQRISNIYTDNSRPQLSATTASGDRLQGTEYTIPKVYAGDVLDVVYGTMSVTAPDGTYAVARDGTVIGEGSDISRDYIIVLEQFGAYTVSYIVTDICGNKLVYEYVLRAADFTAPEVKVVSPETEGNVGKAIKIADIVVTDNKDKALDDFTIYVTVVTPENRSYVLLDENGNSASSFTASHAGVYTIVYMVMDSSGNLAETSYKVNVR